MTTPLLFPSERPPWQHQRRWPCGVAIRRSGLWLLVSWVWLWCSWWRGARSCGGMEKSPRRRVSSLPRLLLTQRDRTDIWLPVFPPVVPLVGSVRRPRMNRMPLRLVSNSGTITPTVGPSRTSTTTTMALEIVGMDQILPHVPQKVMRGRPLMPIMSSHPASTRKPIPRGVEPRVKASSMRTKTMYSSIVICVLMPSLLMTYSTTL